MTASRFVIGIDLGTTNTVMAYAEAFEDRRPEVKQFEIPQLVAAGTVAERSLLPSFVYLPGEHDFKAEMLGLPWSPEAEAAENKKKQKPDWLVGELAKTQGGLVSQRLVHSSKSWLCHDSVDRRADILPWGTESDEKISPVAAAERILRHLRESWNHAMASKGASAAFEKQEIILTVPASFDEVARKLTVEAALAIGITEENLVLLEEPQAAFYAWLSQDPDQRQSMLKAGDKVLVVDMGGGTTDLSLFATSVGDEAVNFQRTAVGEHLLLGGDNIDLALAKTIEAEFKKKTKKLSVRQWQTLLQGCRAAKEKLLQSDDLKEIKIAIPGKGSKLIGGQLKRTLTRDELFERTLEGFFPKVELNDEQAKADETKAGLQEFGLPFESDPAVTRHLLRFLRDHCVNNGKIEVPRAILFNGGVFKTEALRERVVSVLSEWRKQNQDGADADVLVLHSEDLDLAVSYGAAYYGLVRRGYGIRIRAGLPRSYYVGVESGSDQRQAICLISHGIEEGTAVDVEGHELDVLTRQPVGFPLYTSTTRINDKPGDLVDINNSEFREMPPLLTVLKLGRKSKRKSVPVGLRAKLTVIGTLELFCKSLVTDHEWQLDFTVRKATDSDSGPTTEEVERADKVVKSVLTVFRSKAAFDETRERLEKLFKSMEAAAEEKRNGWSLYQLRRIWDDALSPVAKNRHTTALHESRWLNLAGYCLRPGFGDPTDDHRLRSYWRLCLEGMKNAADARVKVEWLVALRRIAGGLSKGQQEQLAAQLNSKLKLKSRLKGHKAEENNEAWRVIANLEYLAPERKVEYGQRLLKAQAHDRGPRCLVWALGRLGARVPVYGTIDTVIDRKIVEEWINTILQWDKDLKTDSQVALISLGRLTGDRTRDIDPKLREKIIYRLKKSGAGANQIRPLQEAIAMASGETSSALGDTIPTGLKLK